MPLLELGTLPLAAQALQDLGLKGTLALIPSWQVGLEQPPSTDLPRLAAEGYQSNEVVYACVREIASTAAEVRLQVVDGQDTALPHHPLQRLLDRPNPEHSSFELLEALLTDLLVYGNAFLLKEPSERTVAPAAVILRPRATSGWSALSVLNCPRSIFPTHNGQVHKKPQLPAAGAPPPRAARDPAQRSCPNDPPPLLPLGRRASAPPQRMAAGARAAGCPPRTRPLSPPQRQPLPRADRGPSPDARRPGRPLEIAA